MLVHPHQVLNLTMGDAVDEYIAGAIPEDVRDGRVTRNLHVAVIAPLTHSEQYTVMEGVRTVPVRPPPGYETRALSAGVDYAQVRWLMAQCDKTHGTASAGGGGEKDSMEVESSHPDLLVIDCESEQLVPADEDCKFVALSYVWGGSRGGDDTIDGITVDDDEREQFKTDLSRRRRLLPRTVRDAMHAVRELGLRFLWVDQYCIDDTEPGRKHHTISNMDAVYRRAALTIVAASGAHSGHGLPGSRRIHCRLDTYSLVENNGGGQEGVGDDEGAEKESYVYVEDAHAELGELVWSTRGWTYQEGLLSRHRLVFTESQAVFQCLHDNGRVARAGDIFYRIEEYTRRHLTYPADSLRAFLGVFRAFEKLRPPAMHYWGVPFVFAADGSIHQLAQGLLWKSQSCALRRIRGFPSWTWAGWEGWADQQQQHSGGGDPDHSVWMYGLLPVDPSLADLEDISIDVPCGTGQLIDIHEYFRLEREGRGSRGLPTEHGIYITAWTTEISFSPGRQREYILDLDTRSDFGLTLGTDDGGLAGRLCSETWTVAVICWSLSHSTHAARGFRTQSIVFGRAGADSVCRVGTLETRWRKQHLEEDGQGRAHIAAWNRDFVRRRLRLV